MSANNLYKYALSLGDDALIIGQRLSEWAYKAPFLEEDIAISNFSLDFFGRANLLLEYAASIKASGITADDLAFKRNEREFSNHLIYEQPNGNFAKTIVRQFLIDTYNELFFHELANSNDNQLSAIAQKSIKEIIYHLRHSSKWVLRLGDGTAESHKKAQFAIDELWMFTGELFQMNQNELEMVDKGIGVDCSNLKANWMENITKIINMATLSIPGDEYMQSGGREGIHTEHLGHMLSDMQYLQRAYPGAEW